jgi:hypothetical protein
MYEKMNKTTDNLTAAERQALMAVLEDIQEQPAPADHRAAPRHSVSVWTQPPANAPIAPGQISGMMVRDVSTGGVGFAAFYPIKAGQEFVLEVQFEEGGQKAFRCQVVRSESSPNGICVGGAKFLP